MAPTTKKPARAKGKPSRIVALRAHNVRSLQHVNIRMKPEGMTIVAGRNGAGKSTALLCIEMLLEWRIAQRKVGKVIRDGQASAWTEIELDDGWKVKRSWKETGRTTLTVTQRGSVPPGGPQSFLDVIRPPDLLDPLAFSRMSPADRRLLLIQIAGLTGELEEAQTRVAEAEEERLEAGREAKRLRAAYDVLPEAPPDTPDETVSVADLAAELEKHQEARREYERKEGVAARMSEIAEEAQEHVEALEVQLQEARTSAETARQIAEEAQANLENASQYDGGAEEAVREAIQRADERNENVRIRERKDAAAIEADRAEEEYANAQSAVESLRAKRDELVEKAELPLPGLAFDSVDATFEGVRWADIGTSKQLRLGLEIGAAQCPGLPVFVMHRAESLDLENLEAVDSWAKERKAQVLAEVVGGEGHEGAYVLEAGQLKGRE